MLSVAALMLVSIYPAFLFLTGSPTPAVIIGTVLWLATLKSMYYGPLAALMSRLFTVSSRTTGLGFSYNMGVTLFCGMGLVIMAWLGGLVGDLAPAYYLTVVCLVSIGALCTVRWRLGLR